MQWWKLTSAVHSSWMVALFSLCIVIGAAISQYFSQWHEIVWPSLALIIMAIALWQKSTYFLPLIIIAGLIFGLWRGSIGQGQVATYTQLYGSTVEITGKVGDDADSTKDGQLVIRLTDIAVDEHPMIGKAWVTAATKLDIKRGDNITLKGTLGPGFGAFVATMYRANISAVKRPQPGDVARVARDWFSDSVRKAIPDPESALGIGYLVGQKRALPDSLAEALKIVGLTHVVVASGYNLTILVRLARRLFVKVSKYVSMLSAVTMVFAFMAVTGASPSMSRASLVACLSLAAWYYGRAFHPLVLLPFAAAITVMIDPSYAWNDLGWQLSFAAFAGVMVMAPLLQRYFFANSEPGIVRQILGETISAHIVTLPILMLAFSQFSNVAIVANLLVLPFVPFAMVLTFIAGICALTVPAAATTIGIPATALLGYMISVATYLSKLPWAQTEIHINGWAVVGMYSCILIACGWMWRSTKYNLRDSNVVE